MAHKEFLDGRVVLHGGDCLEILATLPENSVDSVVCDPPYHLTSIVKRFGAENAAAVKPGKTGAYARASAGFMGKTWDGGDIAFRVELWEHVYRVLKPGGHLVAFSGTRTYHRMAVAIEDAGFEIRDQLGFMYGSGFPKSHNISRNLNDARCACEGSAGAASVLQHDLRSMRDTDVPEGEHAKNQYGQVLHSVVPEQGASSAVLRAKPKESRLRGEQRGMEGRRDLSEKARQLRNGEIRSLPAGTGLNGAAGRLRNGTSLSDGAMGGAGTDSHGMCASHRPQTAQQRAVELGTVAVQQDAQAGRAWPRCERCEKPIIPDGLGTALKPAWEPICLARKPLIGTVAENVLTHGTGAINIDGCRVETADDLKGGAYSESGSREISQSLSPTGMNRPGKTVGKDFIQPIGRWPANVIHDGSDEVVEAFPDSDGSGPERALNRSGGLRNGDWGMNADVGDVAPLRDAGSGSAARFFYQVKKDNICQTDRHGLLSSLEPARIAESSISLQSEAAASALSNAVAMSAANQTLQSQSYQGRDTNVSGAELRIVCASATEAIQSIARRCSLGLLPENITVQLGHVTCVAILGPTGTTTITLSLLRFGRSVDLATFCITETSEEVGALACGKRFHYTAKADAEDRLGSKHPTVKPLDLMQYLVRLVTKKGGTTLDPFAGTGTTGEAAWREGMNAILIEREPEYQADIARRMELATNPTKRAAVAASKNKLDDPNDMPLFGGGMRDKDPVPAA